jgi:hypothetical protein
MGPLKMRLRTNWLQETTRAKTAVEKRMAMVLRAINRASLNEETLASSFPEAIPRPSTIE